MVEGAPGRAREGARARAPLCTLTRIGAVTTYASGGIVAGSTRAVEWDNEVSKGLKAGVNARRKESGRLPRIKSRYA